MQLFGRIRLLWAWNCSELFEAKYLQDETWWASCHDILCSHLSKSLRHAARICGQVDLVGEYPGAVRRSV